MKALIIVVLFVSLFLIGIVSADDIEPIKDAPKLISFTYTETKNSFDIIGMVKSWLGYTPQPDRVYVTIGDRTVAELPKDSKFIGVSIHDTCLEYQYGTDAWYNCEVLIK